MQLPCKVHLTYHFIDTLLKNGLQHEPDQIMHARYDIMRCCSHLGIVKYSLLAGDHFKQGHKLKASEHVPAQLPATAMVYYTGTHAGHTKHGSCNIDAEKLCEQQVYTMIRIDYKHICIVHFCPTSPPSGA